MNRMSDNLKSLPEENIEKIKVSNAEIVVHGTKEKPYFEIKYFDLSDNETHIGYGSYNLDIVFGYLDKYFDIVEKDECGYDYPYNDLISRKSVKSSIEIIRECWSTSPFVSADDMKLYSEVFNVVLQEISDCQTAFDKKKVIEELVELRQREYNDSDEESETMDGEEIYDEGRSQGRFEAYHRAIEIVEKGGIE